MFYFSSFLEIFSISLNVLGLSVEVQSFPATLLSALK